MDKAARIEVCEHSLPVGLQLLFTRFLKVMAAACRTSCLRLGSTAIRNRLTNCPLAYWNCNNEAGNLNSD